MNIQPCFNRIGNTFRVAATATSSTALALTTALGAQSLNVRVYNAGGSDIAFLSGESDVAAAEFPAAGANKNVQVVPSGVVEVFQLKGPYVRVICDTALTATVYFTVGIGN